MPKTLTAEHALVMRWRGKQWDALVDTTTALDLEGSLRSGKTTCALFKELTAMVDHPGLHTLLARWTEDATQSILKPIWRAILQQAGVVPRWNPLEHYDEFANGSRAYIRGLKSQDERTRYGKFRGLTLARAYIDQAEEVPKDIYLELKARLSQKGYPQQIVITPQAVDYDHWIAKEFPEDNAIPHRRYIALSVYDNAHNLDAETLRNLEETYPLGHPKRRTLIEGRRGMNVIGEPVYAGAFNRRLHERALAFNPALPLEEAIDFGQHHPCWVCRQVDPFGAVLVLGGVQGEDLFLDDFMRTVTRYRGEWFGDVKVLKTCCDPAGTHASSQGLRQTAIELLRTHYPRGHAIRTVDNSNAPDVRLAMIEELAATMRRRTSTGEAFGIDDARWLVVSSRRGVVAEKILADGAEAGYVWSPHSVSVNHKPTRQPLKDDKYDHAMNCLEYLQLNFSPRRRGPAPTAAPPPGPVVAGAGAWMG
ncbi:MAG TPA: phage terminase large subunit [Burkholderiales bacterium]|nr:phage terminase large subunit [Burkholderiales bacterium]